MSRPLGSLVTSRCSHKTPAGPRPWRGLAGWSPVPLGTPLPGDESIRRRIPRTPSPQGDSSRGEQPTTATRPCLQELSSTADGTTSGAERTYTKIWDACPSLTVSHMPRVRHSWKKSGVSLARCASARPPAPNHQGNESRWRRRYQSTWTHGPETTERPEPKGSNPHRAQERRPDPDQSIGHQVDVSRHRPGSFWTAPWAREVETCRAVTLPTHLQHTSATCPLEDTPGVSQRATRLPPSAREALGQMDPTRCSPLDICRHRHTALGRQGDRPTRFHDDPTPCRTVDTASCPHADRPSGRYRALEPTGDARSTPSRASGAHAPPGSIHQCARQKG